MASGLLSPDWRSAAVRHQGGSDTGASALRRAVRLVNADALGLDVGLLERLDAEEDAADLAKLFARSPRNPLYAGELNTQIAADRVRFVPAGGSTLPISGTPLQTRPMDSFGRGAAAIRLESPCNKVTSRAARVYDRVGVVPKRCRCRVCPACGKRRGWLVRQKLQSKLGIWRVPRLLTLTVDRKRFNSPVDAHREITGGKYVARLMRRLGIKRWVWVLEFQSASGAGWPHWHLLIDMADLPARSAFTADRKTVYGRAGCCDAHLRSKWVVLHGPVPKGKGRVWTIPHYLDLAKAWRLWRDEWGCGGLDLGKDRHKSMSAAHAVNYLTKYLLKQPPGGYPVWVLKSRRRLRFVAGSAAVGALVSEEDVDRGGGEGEERADPDPLLDRVSACGESSDVFAYVEDDLGGADPETGEVPVKAVFLGTLPISPERLAKLPLLRDGVAAFGRAKVEGERLSFDELERAARAAHRASLEEMRESTVRARRAAFLLTNKFARREALATAGGKDGP